MWYSTFFKIRVGFEFCDKKEKKMVNDHFDPEENPERVLEKFDSGPGILSLFLYSTQEGPSEIHCINEGGRKRTFFVPQHIPGTSRCNVKNSLFVLTKVSDTADSEPEFWLMTCVYSKLGYLFPLDSFDENGMYVPLPQAA